MVSPFELPLNKGLLDARTTGRTFATLRQKFYPVEFFDLCSIIEEMVLRDEIVLIGKFEKLPVDYRNALAPFIRANVFRTMVESTQIIRVDSSDLRLRNAAAMARDGEMTDAQLDDADYAVTRLLGAELDLRIPTIPLLQHLHNYHFVRRPILDNTVCDLYAKYHTAKERAEQLKKFDFNRMGLPPIKIPPIALQVFQRSYSYDQIPQNILAVREDYTRIRATMRDLAEMMSDRELTSERYFALVHQWERRWNSLFENLPSCTMQLGKTAAPLMKDGISLVKALQSSGIIDAITAGASLIKDFAELKGAFALRPVHLSVQNYLRAQPTETIAAVSTIFRIGQGAARDKMNRVVHPSSVWRQT